MINELGLREITHEEFMNLKRGDVVYLRIGGQIDKSVVTSPGTFWNCDADEPGWEVETTNGFSDEYSLLVKK